jgi:hypothetical protein
MGCCNGNLGDIEMEEIPLDKETKQALSEAFRKDAVPLEVKKNQPKNRMSVVIQLSHERVHAGGPRGKRITSGAYLDNQEQSYERDHVVGIDQVPVDRGWIAESGYFAIEVYGEGTLFLEVGDLLILRVSKDRPFVGDLPAIEGLTWRAVDVDELHFTVSVIPR